MTDPAYLRPGRFVESDDPAVIAFAHRAAGDATDPIDVTLRLYYAVRDDIYYDSYQNFGLAESYSGKTALARGRGFCVPKAALLSACARARGIPARLGFADVRNHLATPQMLELNGSDIFCWHAYSDLYLEGRWVKATPAFNLALCERFGVLPLEFDGRSDSIFHPYDRANRPHMEYVNDHGTYADVPFEEIVASLRRTNPLLFMPDACGGQDEASGGTCQGRPG